MLRRTMRVAHFCGAFSPLSQTFIYDYITEMDRQGVDCHVLTPRRESEAERPFSNVHIAPWPSRWNPQRLWYRLQVELGHEGRDTYTHAWPVLHTRLRHLIEELQPDIIHAHFGNVGALIEPLIREMHLPLVVTFYGSDISSVAHRREWGKRYQRLWETAGAVTVLSEDMQRAAIALECPAAKLRIVHLSRDVANFPYRPPRGQVKNLLSVGRLVEKKGHLDVIKAVQRLRDKGYPLHVRIIGEGEQEEKLSSFIQSNNLQEHVELAGALPNEQVIQEMGKADAFILCSKTDTTGEKEGTPTVLVEAQARGLPCISTFHAGIPEMIPEEGHWLLAEEGNVDEITACLEKLMVCSAEEIHHLARAGRAKIEADFNLADEVKKLRAIYAELHVQHQAA